MILSLYDIFLCIINVSLIIFINALIFRIIFIDQTLLFRYQNGLFLLFFQIYFITYQHLRFFCRKIICSQEKTDSFNSSFILKEIEYEENDRKICNLPAKISKEYEGLLCRPAKLFSRCALPRRWWVNLSTKGKYQIL